jgi:exopolysaccharide production protein ExoQ
MLAVNDRSDQPVSQLAIVWLLMIPLFFFACRGVLWFQSSGGNGFEATRFVSTGPANGSATFLVLASIVLCVLLILMTRLGSVLEMCWSNKVFSLLALYALATCGWSQFPKLSLQFGIYIILNLLLVFYLHSRFRPEALMQVFALLGWIVVLSSIVFVVALPQYGVDHRAFTSGSWQGVFIYKNTCAVMATFLLSAAFFVPVRTLRDRVLRTAYILISVLLVLMTRARTGWILLAALLCYVAVTKLIENRKARDSAVVVFMVASVFIAVAVGGVLYFDQILLALGKDPTLTGRTGIWKLAVHAAMKRPLLGYGYRSFWRGLQGESAYISLAENWTVPGAHNGFLETWLDLGLIGVGMVLITMVVAMWKGVACLRQGATPLVKWYVSILLLTVVANTDEMTLMFPNYLTWIMYVLACVGLAHESKILVLGRSHKKPVTLAVHA